MGIFCGIFMEGEMVMISSVIAAHHGHLNLWIVMAIGIAGTYCSDGFYFFLGRKKGKAWVYKNRKFKDKAGIIDRKLEKYPILIFLVYRFMYGFRTVTPLIIGVSKTRTGTFLTLSAISTLIWAAVYGLMGYAFGEVIKSKLKHIENVEEYIIGGLLLVAIIVFIIGRQRKKKLRTIET
jgi:membrane protein DedA with SNARE-associated domain